MQRKKAERTGYITRRDQVKSIKNSMEHVSYLCASQVNSKIDTLERSLSAGIQGLSVISNLQRAMAERKEKSGTNDTKLLNYDTDLASEVSDCQRKINSLDEEITRLQRQYNNEVRAEREAARRAAEALANKAKDLLGV